MSDYQFICAHPTTITDITCSTGTVVLVPAPVPFDISMIDPAAVMAAFAAGFVVAGLPMVTIYGFRFLYKVIMNHKI